MASQSRDPGGLHAGRAASDNKHLLLDLRVTDGVDGQPHERIDTTAPAAEAVVAAGTRSYIVQPALFDLVDILGIGVEPSGHTDEVGHTLL